LDWILVKLVDKIDLPPLFGLGRYWFWMF